MARLLLASALAAATVTSVAAWGELPPALEDGFYQGELVDGWEFRCGGWRRETGKKRGPPLGLKGQKERSDKTLSPTPGRATFFGASKQFEDAFSNGKKNAFGDFLFGSCGYFNKPRSKQNIDTSDLQLPLDGVAALADVNPDFPGSCGRCYEIKCKEGLLIGNDGKPKSIGGEFKYMPSINGSVTDTAGRTFPGNRAEGQGEQYVKCWNKSSIVVKIVDNCPAVLPQGAWANPNKPEPQPWCSSDIYHFDLSYWAFEKLAHPLYGVMNVAFRPVDCETRAPMPLAPGYVSRSIYSNEPDAGWSWQPFNPGEQTLMAEGQASNGGAAACTSMQPKGGVTFGCRRCTEAGYQPFNGAGSVSFWVKPSMNVASKTGRLPLRVALGWPAGNQYCDNTIFLENEKPVEEKGDHKRYEIPISAFACDRQGLNNVDSLTFSNALKASEADEVAFCVDHLEIRGTGPHVDAPQKPAIPEHPERAAREEAREAREEARSQSRVARAG